MVGPVSLGTIPSGMQKNLPGIKWILYEDKLGLVWADFGPVDVTTSENVS